MLMQVPDVRLVDSKEIQEIEPECRGLKAIWSPHTGIVDWGQVRVDDEIEYSK